MSQVTKREFLKFLMLGTATSLFNQNEALALLDQIKPLSLNPIEKDLISNPVKQILIAEDPACQVPGCVGSLKTKCAVTGFC